MLCPKIVLFMTSNYSIFSISRHTSSYCHSQNVNTLSENHPNKYCPQNFTTWGTADLYIPVHTRELSQGEEFLLSTRDAYKGVLQC